MKDTAVPTPQELNEPSDDIRGALFGALVLVLQSPVALEPRLAYEFARQLFHLHGWLSREVLVRGMTIAPPTPDFLVTMLEVCVSERKERVDAFAEMHRAIFAAMEIVKPKTH